MSDDAAMATSHAKRIAVKSPFPNLRGNYVERGSSEGRPAFIREAAANEMTDAVTWIFFSPKFGRGACWYFGRSLPQRGSLQSFCCSLDDAPTPETAQWPSDDISEIRDAKDDPPPPTLCTAGGGQSSSAPIDFKLPPKCLDCIDLQSLNSGFVCQSCAPSSEAKLLSALCLLKTCASGAVRQRLASALAVGDSDAKLRLGAVASAFESQDMRPVILAEPPPNVELGPATVTLSCEAICANGGDVKYQWCKNDLPLRRAERPRYLLCGANAQDVGRYICEVSGGGKSVSTQACEVKLSATETAKRDRFESPLHRATEAEKLGQAEVAVKLLSEAIEAIRADEGFESACANTLCRRAELLLKLERWQDAFKDASEAVKISPGLSRAHAARGRSAVKLGNLAEAVSSWETVELLGGVPEAAHEAEMCRERLQAFFAERNAKRGSASEKAAFASGYKDSAESSHDGDDGPEASWRKSGWQGRYTGGRAGDFFGQGGGSTGASSGGGERNAPLTQALQRQLKVLGFADTTVTLPSADAVRGAYRRLALQAHPDKPGGSKTAFQDLQNAYEAVLSAVQ